MTNGEFRAWLKGFFELEEPPIVFEYRQLAIICNHLCLAQAVSVQLDEENHWLKEYLTTIVSRLKASQPVDFEQVTGDIYAWLFH